MAAGVGHRRQQGSGPRGAARAPGGQRERLQRAWGWRTPLWLRRDVHKVVSACGTPEWGQACHAPSAFSLVSLTPRDPVGCEALYVYASLQAYRGNLKATLRRQHAPTRRGRCATAPRRCQALCPRLGWARVSGVRRHGAPQLVVWTELMTHAFSAVGIYLGRFQRFNSWDLLMAPGQVLRSAIEVMTASRPLVVIGATFVILTLFYWCMKQLTLGMLRRIRAARGPAGQDAPAYPLPWQ